MSFVSYHPMTTWCSLMNDERPFLNSRITLTFIKRDVFTLELQLLAINLARNNRVYREDNLYCGALHSSPTPWQRLATHNAALWTHFFSQYNCNLFVSWLKNDSSAGNTKCNLCDNLRCLWDFSYGMCDNLCCLWDLSYGLCDNLRCLWDFS